LHIQPDSRFDRSSKLGDIMAGSKTLADKLYLKSGYRAAMLNTPSGHENALAPLPSGVMVTSRPQGEQDFVLAFVHNRAEADTIALDAIAALKQDGVLWLAYPKKTGSIKTDITRDKGWDAVVKAGWEPVNQIAMDDTWSALRFKPKADIKRGASRKPKT
jgi:hypothetical protein